MDSVRKTFYFSTHSIEEFAHMLIHSILNTWTMQLTQVVSVNSVCCFIVCFIYVLKCLCFVNHLRYWEMSGSKHNVISRGITRTIIRHCKTRDLKTVEPISRRLTPCRLIYFYKIAIAIVTVHHAITSSCNPEINSHNSKT